MNLNVHVDGLTNWQLLLVVVVIGILIQTSYNLGYHRGWHALAACWRHRQP
jgi:hypothetical protein